MSVEQALARPNYVLKKETPHHPVRRFLFYYIPFVAYRFRFPGQSSFAADTPG